MKDIPTSVFSAHAAGKPLSVGARLLLVLLWVHAQAFDKRTGVAFGAPDHDTLQEQLGCSRSVLYKRLRQLRDTGWIRRARRPFAGRTVTGWELRKSTYVDFPESTSGDFESPNVDFDAECELQKSSNVDFSESTSGDFESSNVDFGVHKIGREGPQTGTDLPPGKVHKPGLLGPQTGTFGSTNRDFAPQLTNSVGLTTKTTTPSANGAIIDIGVHRRAQLEAELIEVVVEFGFAGTCPGHGFVSPAVERLLEGEATMDDVVAVAKLYAERRRRGDRKQRPFPSLFYAGKAWERTQREYLLREPAAFAKGRAPDSALSGAESEWKRRQALGAEGAQPKITQAEADELWG